MRKHTEASQRLALIFARSAIFIHALAMAIMASRYSGTEVRSSSAAHSSTWRLHSSIVSSGTMFIDHPAKSGITFSRHESGSVFGHLANMRLRRAGSSRSSGNNQTDRPQPAVDGNTAPAKAAREGLATARPVVFAASAGRFWISRAPWGDLMV